MSVAEKLAELNGPNHTGLVTLYRGGVIPLRVVTDYEAWQTYQALRELPTYCDQPGELVQRVAQEHGLHRATVYRMVRAMQAQL